MLGKRLVWRIHNRLSPKELAPNEVNLSPCTSCCCVLPSCAEPSICPAPKTFICPRQMEHLTSHASGISSQVVTREGREHREVQISLEASAYKCHRRGKSHRVSLLPFNPTRGWWVSCPQSCCGLKSQSLQKSKAVTANLHHHLCWADF